MTRTLARTLAIASTSLLLTACGDSPTKPTAPAVVAQPPATAQAQIVSVGDLYATPTYRCEPPDAQCSNPPTYLIEGVGHNIGATCATEVVGTTVVEGVATSWSLPAGRVVTAGSQFWYGATVQLQRPTMPRHVASYETTFKWKSVACPIE